MDFLEGDDVAINGNALDEEAAGEAVEREERGLLDLGFWLLAFGFWLLGEEEVEERYWE